MPPSEVDGREELMFCFQDSDAVVAFECVERELVLCLYSNMCHVIYIVKEKKNGLISRPKLFYHLENDGSEQNDFVG